MDSAQRALLADFGVDPDGPEVLEAAEDTAAHMDLIETLVCLRTDRKLTQIAVAARMGTTQSRVSNFERIGGDPRLSTILRYARAVGVKIRMTPVVSSARTFKVASGTASSPPSAIEPPSSAWRPAGLVGAGLVRASGA